MSLGTVAGTIGTVVGLGITLGALGLAFEFAGRAVESTKPRSQRRKGPLVFDTSLPKNGLFTDTARQERRRRNNVFDPLPNVNRQQRMTRRASGKKNGRNGTRRRKNQGFGGDFF